MDYQFTQLGKEFRDVGTNSSLKFGIYGGVPHFECFSLHDIWCSYSIMLDDDDLLDLWNRIRFGGNDEDIILDAETGCKVNGVPSYNRLLIHEGEHSKAPRKVTWFTFYVDIYGPNLDLKSEDPDCRWAVSFCDWECWDAWTELRESVRNLILMKDIEAYEWDNNAQACTKRVM